MTNCTAAPKVSVLMPVYNGERYLREAIDSILKQTLRDFEFIIVDDGSTDSSPDIIASYSDPRIRMLRNAVNCGLVASLNRAIEVATTPFLARMDSDDISLPDRLLEQLRFMQANSDVAASGTWAIEIDADGKQLALRTAPTGEEVAHEFWRPSPLIHPTAIIRRSHLGELRYDPRALHAEDYDLWLRLANKHPLQNLPRALLLYRVHGSSITQTHLEIQRRSSYESLCRNTLLEISFEEYLELVDVKWELSPLGRAALRRRIAKAIDVPYRRLITKDLEYTRWWFLRVFRRFKMTALETMYRAWCRLRKGLT